MDSAIVYHWRHAFPGRELASVELKIQTDAMMTKAMEDGKITDFAWYLSPSGDMNFLVVRGEMEKLQALTAEPDAVMHAMKIGMANEDFSWSFCVTGPMVEAATDMYVAAAASMPA
jgi:hypothetical protein